MYCCTILGRVFYPRSTGPSARRGDPPPSGSTVAFDCSLAFAPPPPLASTICLGQRLVFPRVFLIVALAAPLRLRRTNRVSMDKSRHDEESCYDEKITLRQQKRGTTKNALRQKNALRRNKSRYGDKNRVTTNKSRYDRKMRYDEDNRVTMKQSRYEETKRVTTNKSRHDEQKRVTTNKLRYDEHTCVTTKKSRYDEQISVR